MNRKDYIDEEDLLQLYLKITRLHEKMDKGFQLEHLRSLPLNEQLVDRWERAKKLDFGAGSSIYDSSLVIGHPKVGMHCWIGPGTILDGSGGLSLGDFCTVSAGAHIYSHDNIKRTLSSGQEPIERQPVTIGNNVYIAPNAVITKGVTIGNRCVIAAFTLVNRDVPDNSIVAGQPGRIIGKVKITDTGITFNYVTR
jgi:acetyltransferase-like isoleucine patch superfamily enzyme